LKNRCAQEIEGTFGAVGVMRDKLLAGQACDILILTQALIDELADQGLVRRDTAAPLGVVKTGIAVKAGEARPDVSTPEALKAALRRAAGIYFPDPEKATAGIHFMKVLKTLGVDEELRERIRTFPNGATAMGEMAQAPQPNVIGCTQVTEILHAPGVELVGLLPRQLELATIYTAAVCTKSQSPKEADAFVRLLAGQQSAAVRADCGFNN
jgi:molybdate transport system substrate-binding protein